MKTQRLISSYDEINDIFCGKIEGKNGYFANYAMNEGIFINIDKNGCPVSVFIDRASDILNVKKEILEESDIKIGLGCDYCSIYFVYLTENLLNLFSSLELLLCQCALYLYFIFT